MFMYMCSFTSFIQKYLNAMYRPCTLGSAPHNLFTLYNVVQCTPLCIMHRYPLVPNLTFMCTIKSNVINFTERFKSKIRERII